MATRAKPTTQKGRCRCADQAAGRDGADQEGHGRGRKNKPVSSALRPRRCCRYCEPRNSPAMSRPAATSIREGAGCDRTARQQVQAHQGSRYGVLDEHEHPVQDDGYPAGQERAEIRPALLAGVEHAVDERAGGGGDGHRAHHIEASGAAQMARWRHGPDGGQPTA